VSEFVAFCILALLAVAWFHPDGACLEYQVNNGAKQRSCLKLGR
jgi:hypothetical protein